MPEGIDTASPEPPSGLDRGPTDLSVKGLQETREAQPTTKVPHTQLKWGEWRRVYDDVRMAAQVRPDIIYLGNGAGKVATGRGAATFAREENRPSRCWPHSGGAAGARGRRASPTEVDLGGSLGGHSQGWGRRSQSAWRWVRTRFAIGHSALMALNLQQGIPGGTGLRGHGRPWPGRGRLPLHHTGRARSGSRRQAPELRSAWTSTTRLTSGGCSTFWARPWTLEVADAPRACG